jgi:hypothetical protein
LIKREYFMKLCTVVALAAVSFLPVEPQAATISQKTADNIHSGFAGLLPAPFDQIFKLSPAADKYKARIDLAPVLDLLQNPLHISEMTPIEATLSPRADGLWNIATHGGMWLIGDTFSAAGPSHFQLTSSSYDGSAIYDPAAGYPRSGQVTFKDWQYSARGRQTSHEETANAYTRTLVVKDSNGQGRIDATVTSTARDIWQRTKTPRMPEALEVSIASADATDEAADVDTDAIRQLGRIFLDGGMASFASLTDVQRQRISEIVTRRWPIASSFSEKADFSNIEIRYGKYAVKSETARIAVEADTEDKKGKVDVALVANKATLRPGDLPRAAELAMPDKIGIAMRFSSLDLIGGLNSYLAAQPADGAAEQQDILTRLLMTSDKLTIEYHDTFARSPYYDVAMEGWISIDPRRPERGGEGDITITARAIDKTVAFLQANANAYPPFGQASFAVLMAKGMGKQQADGSVVWHIQVDKAGHRFINGHQLGH